MQDIKKKADVAASFLKGLANEDRLLILCCLAEGPCSVSGLIAATGIAQTSMSQHLKKLKDEGIVTYTRDHRTLIYEICHDGVYEVMQVLYNNFCKGMKK